MHIRPMQVYDLPQSSNVGAKAFADDSRYLYTNPYLKQYPEDYRQSFFRRLRKSLHLQGVHLFVCVSDWRDSNWLPKELAILHRAEGETVLGYSIWVRAGSTDDPTARPWLQNNHGLSIAAKQHFWAWEQYYIELFGLDRSMDLAAERRIREGMAALTDEWPFHSYWRMRGLATHPDVARRGVAKLLMKWGMDRAQEEGVPVTLSASEVGAHLYRRLGFRTVRWCSLDSSNPDKAHENMIWDWRGDYVRHPSSEETWIDFPDAGRHEVEVVWKKSS